MSREEVEITREELYRLVWSEPTQKVAKDLGISDVGLAKICRKLHIPKPPRGHWRQIEVGLRVQPVPLPRPLKTTPSRAWIKPTEPPDPPAALDPEVAARVQPDLNLNDPIRVDDVLRNPHPAIRQTKSALEGAHENSYAKVQPAWNQPSLDIRVSRGSVNRALRIMDAILKAVEKRGFSVEPGDAQRGYTRIVVRSQKIKVRLTEGANRFETNPPERRGILPSSMVSKEFEYRPTGKLIFLIEQYCAQNIKKRWADRVREPLEDQLNDIVKGIITIGAALEVESIRRQERERLRIQEEIRRHQEQKRREEEEKRFQAVEQQANLWTRSRHLRAFIRNCERSIVGESGPIDPEGPVAAWLDWARGRADLLDPFRNGILKGIVEKLNEPTSKK